MVWIQSDWVFKRATRRIWRIRQFQPTIQRSICTCESIQFQVSYIINTKSHSGLFGLGNQPLIYGTFGNHSVPSYFVTLRNKSLIPSLSWSYTAGASYRLSAGQYAQLIFGGYDTSRFQSNGVEFTISQDVTRDLVIGVQSILYTSATSSSLLSEPIYAFIESTDPNIGFLWVLASNLSRLSVLPSTMKRKSIWWTPHNIPHSPCRTPR